MDMKAQQTQTSPEDQAKLERVRVMIREGIESIERGEVFTLEEVSKRFGVKLD